MHKSNSHVANTKVCKHVDSDSPGDPGSRD